MEWDIYIKEEKVITKKIKKNIKTPWGFATNISMVKVNSLEEYDNHD